tara:strand:+ start:599 stop:928 length:330 start_codon:yes stop_codon:yes gene_type:complete
MNYKKNEIKEYFEDFINDIDKETLNELIEDQELHNEAFNTDYYIIYTYDAKKWLGDKVFEVIEFIKEYEEMNFGEVYTDLSDPCKIVNMYVYIIGEEIVYDYYKECEAI